MTGPLGPPKIDWGRDIGVPRKEHPKVQATESLREAEESICYLKPTHVVVAIAFHPQHFPLCLSASFPCVSVTFEVLK